jgi:predicted solute-binding protein
MKYSLLLFFSLFIGNVFAQTPNSIDMQITAIQKAPPEQRVKLMNAFKRKLIRMNQTQRTNTIKKMRMAMHAREHGEGAMHTHMQHYVNDVHLHHGGDVYHRGDREQEEIHKQLPNNFQEHIEVPHENDKGFQ